MEIKDGICHEGGVSPAVKVSWRKKTTKITAWLPKRVLRIISALHYVWGEYEQLNMAKYGCRRSKQPENVNFEPIIRGLKSDTFDWDQV